MIEINEKQANLANLSGKGGKEYLLKKVFTVEGLECKPESKPLYDFLQGKRKLEFKKQGNTQWFDIGKYHNLTQEDKNIDMVFVVTSKGKTDKIPTGEILYIATMKLGTMIHLLLNNAKYSVLGWTKENFKTCYEQKIKYPTQQAKVKLDIRDFITEPVHKEYRKILFINKKLLEEKWK